MHTKQKDNICVSWKVFTHAVHKETIDKQLTTTIKCMIKWNNKCLIKWTVSNVSSSPRQWEKDTSSTASLTSLLVHTGPVISSKAGDITLPRKSLLILPCCFPLSHSPAVSQPGHFTCKCRLNFCQSAPDTPHRHTCVSQLLSCCLCISPSALQSVLTTHCLLVGTVPRLAPSQTCFATLDWQNAPSLSTLQIPHTSFHQNACSPLLLLLSLSLFCTTAEINTLKVCPPTSQRKIMLPLLLPGTNKALTHLNAWLLCNHTEGKTKSSINNVTSRHRIRYQVHSTGIWTSTVSLEMHSILYVFMNQQKKMEFESPCLAVCMLTDVTIQYTILPAQSKLFLIDSIVWCEL